MLFKTKTNQHPHITVTLLKTVIGLFYNKTTLKKLLLNKNCKDMFIFLSTLQSKKNYFLQFY